MPRNPRVRPAIEDTTARKFKGKVDSTRSMTIRKGKTAPTRSRTKPTAISFNGFPISFLYW